MTLLQLDFLMNLQLLFRFIDKMVGNHQNRRGVWQLLDFFDGFQLEIDIFEKYCL